MNFCAHPKKNFGGKEKLLIEPSGLFLKGLGYEFSRKSSKNLRLFEMPFLEDTILLAKAGWLVLGNFWKKGQLFIPTSGHTDWAFVVLECGRHHLVKICVCNLNQK